VLFSAGPQLQRALRRLAPLALLPLGACHLLDSGCDAYAGPSLDVNIRYASTTVARRDSIIISVADSTRGFSVLIQADSSGISWHRFFESSVNRGVWTVVLRLAGYQTWIRSNVVIKEAGCHTKLTSVTAHLVPL